MKRLLCACLFLIVCLLPASGFAGFVYQDFEPDNGSTYYGSTTFQRYPYYCWSRLSATGEPVYAGKSSWKDYIHVYCRNEGSTIGSQLNSTDIDFVPSRNDSLSFWVYVNGFYNWGGGNNNVRVTFYDHSKYAGGFDVWTTEKDKLNFWSRFIVPFSMLPSDFDLSHISSITIAHWWPAEYYLDDVQVIRADRVYQTFETRGTDPGEYGWKWNEADSFELDGGTLKLTTQGNWGGCGIKSQQEHYFEGNQSFWHNNLNPALNDRLVFWVKASPWNGMDNNMGVQFYDHANHNTDDTKGVVWPSTATRTGEWTRVQILFKDLPADLNLADIDKIQLQEYWPGTYWYDSIKASGRILKIKESSLSDGIVTWDTLSVPAVYILEESRLGPDGPWTEVYRGTGHTYQVSQLNRTWYRARWQDADGAVPYISEPSDSMEYAPPALFISYQPLRSGRVQWTRINQASFYQVQSARSEDGPWTTIYTGAYTTLRGLQSEWYRVRAFRGTQSSPTASSDWSKPQSASRGYLKQDGTVIRDRDGSGKQVVLQGVNLGSCLVTEQWMTGIGDGDSPAVEDEYSLRQVLTQRFGNRSDDLLDTYRNAYISEKDLDLLVDMKMNFVRLPIYYRLLMDENGKWVKQGGSIDFSRIDRIVNACADRGIYVLIDLHGAPGSQSLQDHTGRKNYNKLFEESSLGETYRLRTISVWKELARHYRDNPWVCGYDLLNEPTGSAKLPLLWQTYDRIYDAIRLIDTDHIIMMEGVWDWATLPKPANMGWQNVVYEFHYYLWDYNEDPLQHQIYIDSKVAENRIYQSDYQVPVFIGEFTCFNIKCVWDYYLTKFNEEKYSWAMWCYKCRFAPSEWGFYNHANYTGSLPRFRAVEADGTKGDTFAVLTSKLKQFATLDYHARNYTLTKLVKGYLVQPDLTGLPYIQSLSSETVQIGQDYWIRGRNFGVDRGQVLFGGVSMPVISWSDTAIHTYIWNTETRPFAILSVMNVSGQASNETLLNVIPSGGKIETPSVGISVITVPSSTPVDPVYPPQSTPSTTAPNNQMPDRWWITNPGTAAPLNRPLFWTNSPSSSN